MPGLLGSELKGARESIENLVRRPHVASLLHALVIVRAHPGQQGQFLAPQPGHAPSRTRFQAEVFRSYPGPAGPEELGEFLPRVSSHVLSMTRCAGWVWLSQEEANDHDSGRRPQDRVKEAGEERNEE